MRKHNSEKGQALVIILMIVALTATITGTAVFRTVNQTRQTNEIEEQQKASNAAQGIIEKILNNENVDTTQDFGGGEIGKFNANVAPVFTSEASAGTSFITKLIPKDSQYIFYLQQYNFSDNSFTGNTFTIPTLNILFDSDTNTSTCPVLELIFINQSNQIAKRSVTKACGGNNVSGTEGVNGIAVTTSSRNRNDSDGNSIAFQRYISLSGSIVSGYRMLVVRPLFDSTRLAFESSSGLPPQGEIITSQAQSGGGAQSTETVIRYYPQIPDYFFATSF